MTHVKNITTQKFNKKHENENKSKKKQSEHCSI